MTDWIPRPHGTEGLPAGITPSDHVEYRLAGDPHVYHGEARELNWRDGPGEIEWYRRLVPASFKGVGDVNGTTKGTAARFNASKPDLSLIPAGVIGGLGAWRKAYEPESVTRISWDLLLMRLGDFQMREDGTDALYHCLHLLDDDGKLWADVARVFDYGRAKYAPWNWARGQAWSIPIASAARHAVFGTLRGENLDPESGLTHRGHIGCNLVMLLWFWDHYPEGDDRYAPPAAA